MPSIPDEHLITKTKLLPVPADATMLIGRKSLLRHLTFEVLLLCLQSILTSLWFHEEPKDRGTVVFYVTVGTACHVSGGHSKLSEPRQVWGGRRIQ